MFGCGHAGDGNVHLAVFQPDPAKRTELMHSMFEVGMQLGGAISGEHGMGREKKQKKKKKKYFLARWRTRPSSGSCTGSSRRSTRRASSTPASFSTPPPVDRSVRPISPSAAAATGADHQRSRERA